MASRGSDPWLGKSLANRYLIESRLGEGGMGYVYKARSTDGPVALKVIHPHLSKNTNIIHRFRREAAVAARIESPYTVKILDFDYTEDGVLYIAMELLRGKTLEELLKLGGPMPAARVAALGAQLGRGLATAHVEGVIHRDLKPGNVMVLSGDRLKILDFGIARVLQSDEPDTGYADQETRWKALTQAGALIGTLDYMSPEQIAHEPIDHRSDLYSMGVLLYEMLAGRPPFECATPRTALRAHLYTDPQPIHGAPRELLKFVMDLLAKSPDKRIQTGLLAAKRLEAMELSEADDVPLPGAFQTKVPATFEAVEIPDERPRQTMVPENIDELDEPDLPALRPNRTMVPEFIDELDELDEPDLPALRPNRTMVPENIDELGAPEPQRHRTMIPEDVEDAGDADDRGASALRPNRTMVPEGLDDQHLLGNDAPDTILPELFDEPQKPAARTYRTMVPENIDELDGPPFEVEQPEPEIPTFETPAAAPSSFELPSFNPSSFGGPTFEVSTFEVSAFDEVEPEIPTFDEPDFESPTSKYREEELSSASLPAIKPPEVHGPDAEVPTFEDPSAVGASISPAVPTALSDPPEAATALEPLQLPDPSLPTTRTLIPDELYETPALLRDSSVDTWDEEASATQSSTSTGWLPPDPVHIDAIPGLPPSLHAPLHQPPEPQRVSPLELSERAFDFEDEPTVAVKPERTPEPPAPPAPPQEEPTPQPSEATDATAPQLPGEELPPRAAPTAEFPPPEEPLEEPAPPAAPPAPRAAPSPPAEPPAPRAAPLSALPDRSPEAIWRASAASPAEAPRTSSLPPLPDRSPEATHGKPLAVPSHRSAAQTFDTTELDETPASSDIIELQHSLADENMTIPDPDQPANQYLAEPTADFLLDPLPSEDLEPEGSSGSPRWLKWAMGLGLFFLTVIVGGVGLFIAFAYYISNIPI